MQWCKQFDPVCANALIASGVSPEGLVMAYFLCGFREIEDFCLQVLIGNSIELLSPVSTYLC